jgi:hypothetical protein
MPGKGDFRELAVSASSLLPSAEEAAAALGYPEGRIPEFFLDMAVEVIKDAERLSQPRAGFALWPFLRSAEGGNGIRIGDRDFDVGPIISMEMRRAESAAVFVCTIGPGLEAYARESIDGGDGPKGYMADAIASLMAEAAGDLLQEEAKAAAESLGLGISERFSPGYCTWPVSDQGRLFSLLPPGACGVALTDSSLMVPLKSLSGIIGMGPGMEARGYRCAICGFKGCASRGRTHTRAREAIHDR